MPRIRVLPDPLINQIAAGEVVERPASVVKELVENALDARARRIAVRLVAGGRELVEVEDDGCGMDADDAALAVERHATSKIASADDLFSLTSFGFRGEALPSIAAASRFVMETATVPGEGTRIEIEFGGAAAVRPCARPRGTRVEVRDLFERLPARRKFLRRDATELRHAVATLTSLAYLHPDVGFSLESNGRVVLDLPPVADREQRLPDLVGPERAAAAVRVEHRAGAVGVRGFLLPARGSAEAVLAVNGRVVRDRLLVGTVNRALRGADGRLEADTFLNIEVPHDAVDVNVHPTKAEVRFVDPGRVVAAVSAALVVARPSLHGPVGIRRVVTVAAPVPAVLPFAAPATWPRTSGPSVGEAARPFEAAADASRQSAVSGMRYLGQYRDTYLVVEDDQGLLLVDQHVAHERVLVERLLDDRTPPAVQRLLVPEVVELPTQLAATAEDAAAELAAIGLEIEPVSGRSVRVLGVPAPLPVSAAGALVERVLRDLAEGAEPATELRERAAASLACHAAIKKNRPLSRAEAEQLLRDLASTRERHRCPHGRPIVLRLAHDEIERRIGRR
ncbi:MAG: DNA mismatch repair endonuclease MutL [Acidobacteriota bacterium]